MDIVLRNLQRLVFSDAGNQEREAIEPMTEWKWNKLYQLANQYGVGAWVADGMRVYADDFFLQPSPALRQKLLEAPTEKDPECLEKFELLLHRSSGRLNRFSKKSLQAYADEFIKTVSNIEE